jgi:membrane fusion protein (multidrug efflux system)
MKNNLIILLLFSWLIISCDKNDEKRPKGPLGKEMQVDAYLVQKSDLSNSIATVGTFISNEEVDIKSAISGNVISINFQEGKSVSKGQLLVQIDSREWKSLLKSSEIKLQNLKKEYQRKKEVQKLNGISLEELEKTETQIAIEESNIEQLKVKIDYSEIRAPFAGIIGLREISPGAYVQQGQIIAKLVSNNPIKIEFSVPADFANQLPVNTKLTVISKSTFDTLQATIYAKEPAIDQSTRNLKVRALANNSSGKYIPGDFVEILLNLQEIKSVILLPISAIVPKLNEQTVYLVKDGMAVETIVTTGIRNDKYVQILSGIAEGDLVMVTGLVNIRNNSPVKVKQTIK